jgi:hypothetical protein
MNVLLIRPLFGDVWMFCGVKGLGKTAEFPYLDLNAVYGRLCLYGAKDEVQLPSKSNSIGGRTARS